MTRALIKNSVVLALVLAGVYACVYAVIRDRCTVTAVSEAISPDGAWKALVDDELCESPYLTHETAGLRLVSMNDPARSADILGVSASGADEYPITAWTAPRTLQVDVPGSLYLKVLKCDFDGVRIDIRFPPDDAANRAAIYRQTGKPDPDPDATSTKKCP